MDDNDLCPLCCEELDMSDRNFFPCKCGYQVCMWCWHRIRESESGLCPACRTPYGDDPHEFSAVDMEEVVKLTKEKAAAEKKERDRLKLLGKQEQPNVISSTSSVGSASSGGITNMLCGHIQSASNNGMSMEDSSSMLPFSSTGSSAPGVKQLEPPKDRNQLSNMRVIRRNLVYAVGLPPSIATEETLRKPEYFGEYGKVNKIVLNRNHNGNGDPRRASASAYVTFAHKEDTLTCILALDGYYLDGRNIRASYGTSKYCSAFIKNVRCNNPDCTYLHSMGEAEDTFTKQEIQAGYVTSGRDVLARQQQLFHQNGPVKRKVGGGGPSGTGKVPPNPVFPPPVYEEPVPNKALARASSAGTAGAGSHSTKRSTPRSNSLTRTPNTIAAPRKVPPANTTAAAVVASGGASHNSANITALKQTNPNHHHRNTANAQPKEPTPNTSTNNSRSATPTTTDSSTSYDEGFIQTEIKNQSVGAIGSSNHKPKNDLVAGYTHQGDGFIGGSILVSNSKTAPVDSVGVIGGYNLNLAAQDNSPSASNYLGTIGPAASASNHTNFKKGDEFGVLAASTESQAFPSNNYQPKDAKKWNNKEDSAFASNLFGGGSLGDGIWGEGSSNFLNPKDGARFLNQSDNRAPGSNNPNRSESTAIVGGGVIFESNHPYPGVDTGSSALASMLGIDLPTGSGSLRDTALNVPVPPPNNFYNSNAIPIQAPSNSNTLWNSNHTNIEQANQYTSRNQGVIGSNPNRFNNNCAVGGVTIGGRGYNNAASANNDIALLQSLLPGVHITSGSAHQPAAPNTMWGGAQTTHNPVIGSRPSENSNTDTWGNLSVLQGGNNTNNSQQKNNPGGMPNQSSIW